jgi:hypothetical protein
MPTQTTDLFLLEDLEDAGRTSELAESDLAALRAVADWIKTYVVKPHKDLVGHAGPSVPSCPCPWNVSHCGSLQSRSVIGAMPDVVKLMSGYKRRLLEAEPTDGHDVNYNVIVVVFTDLSADRAQGVFDDVLQQLAVPSYVEDGLCSDRTTKATR